MKTLPLGTTGLNVSALCLGAMYLGTRNDEASSYQLLDQYLEAGGTFIDTANIYSWWVSGFQGGESENLLGRWMRARQNRQQLFIASKVGFGYPGVERGLTARLIEKECDTSLRRLGVDTIDLYYAHVDDYQTPQEESLAAFDRLVQSGKVRSIGASNFLAWRLEEARWIAQNNGWASYCCVQQRHTYLRPKPGASFDPQMAVNNDLLDYCRRRPVTLLAYSALLSGAYTRADRPLPGEYAGADSAARLLALRNLAREKSVTPNQLILAWMLHGDPVVIPLLAASTTDQLQENLRALDITLSKEEMNLLDQAGA